MKKLVSFFGLLSMLTVAGLAQESRQDISMSFVGTIQPIITGNNATQASTLGIGDLIEYRFMLNPSNALEANYEYSQFTQKYVTSFANARIHSRYQEASFEYIHSFVYRKFNPFIGTGAGMFIFNPIDDTHTTDLAAKQTSTIGFLFGGGIAYELSPSWDLRVEYRGTVVKDTEFGLGIYNTNRFYVIEQPAIGFAYHF
jgi:opacity protein-like surface antigen